MTRQEAIDEIYIDATSALRAAAMLDDDETTDRATANILVSALLDVVNVLRPFASNAALGAVHYRFAEHDPS